MLDKKHYEAIKDIHVNLENRNHAIDEYGYGPLNPQEKSSDFWNDKAKTWKSSVEEAKKSRCYNCAAFNQTTEVIKAMGEALGPVGDKIVEKANLGYCEFFNFKCAGDRTCDAWVVNGPLKEGIADKLGAFGRGFADKATLGGYKYARAAVDYGAKKALKGLGLKGGEDTTYERELEQEKEKLSKDYEKEALASAAGDIAGHAMPYVPVVGAAIQAAKGAVDTVKGYSDKAAPVADKIRKGFQENLKISRKKPIEEDAPANAAGGGNIAGLGVGPQGEPGITPSARKSYKKRNKDGVEELKNDLSLMRRGQPAVVSEAKMGKFAGNDTFIVPSNTFQKARMEKKKGKHWKTYIGEDEHGMHIREYANKNKKKPIILQDESTGVMCYARYGSKNK